MLFLLDELAQLGYLPDVEQAIEVLRALKLVVWSVFQTLSQIKLYKKPDLFLGAPIKQIFTNDDVGTMRWIQALGGKKTILTRTLSNNEGEAKPKMQLMGGSSSKGTGESIQETGVDLIHLNQIRELKDDEQYIFMQGMKPIHCKKVRYFEHPLFKVSLMTIPLKRLKEPEKIGANQCRKVCRQDKF
jgi:type IV secretion system protein VirD4